MALLKKDAAVADNIVSINKKYKRPYINFRMRKFIYGFILSNQIEMSKMTSDEKAKFISESIEEIISDNFWIKDMRKNVDYHKKAI